MNQIACFSILATKAVVQLSTKIPLIYVIINYF
jgi:hypothetical protein